MTGRTTAMPQIYRLNHSLPEQARAIHALSLASYAVEGRIIGAADFPPLRAKLESVQKSGSRFYGVNEQADEPKQRLAAVCQVEPKTAWIERLVVHPHFFRRGLASLLMQHVLSTHPGTLRVSTASKNLPALALYQRFGFVPRPLPPSPEGIELVELVLER